MALKNASQTNHLLWEKESSEAHKTIATIWRVNGRKDQSSSRAVAERCKQPWIPVQMQWDQEAWRGHWEPV